MCKGDIRSSLLTLQQPTVGKGIEKGVYVSLDFTSGDIDIPPSQKMRNVFARPLSRAETRNFCRGLVQLKPPFRVQKQVATSLSIEAKANFRTKPRSGCDRGHAQLSFVLVGHMPYIWSRACPTESPPS